MQNDDKRTSDIGASDARPPDDGLILRIAEGDTAALEVLYRQTSASVYGFALSILRDPTAAEDVMQDTFGQADGVAADDRAQPGAYAPAQGGK